MRIHAAVTHYSDVLYRDQLKTDRLYVDDSDGGSLFTPDGEGVLFFDTVEEGLEQSGLTIIHHVGKVDLDRMDHDGTGCSVGRHTPGLEEDGETLVRPYYCVDCGEEGASVPHRGHMSMTGWFCDTCNSHYCELA